MLAATEKATFIGDTNLDSLPIFALSLEEMDQVIRLRTKEENSKFQWETLKNKIETTINYSPSVWDKALLGQLVSEWEYAGTQSFIKIYKGKPHIMLKGRPELRNILDGVSHASESAKVVNIGLARPATVNAVKSDSFLTTVFRDISRKFSSDRDIHKPIFS